MSTRFPKEDTGDKSNGSKDSSLSSTTYDISFLGVCDISLFDGNDMHAK